MTDIFIIDPREESRGRNYIRKVINNALVDAGLTLDAKVYVGRSVSEIRQQHCVSQGKVKGKGGPQNVEDVTIKQIFEKMKNDCGNGYCQFRINNCGVWTLNDGDNNRLEYGICLKHVKDWVG